MAFRLTPQPGEPGADRASAGADRDGGRLERRLLRDGEQVIARGSLACPRCELPLPAAPPMTASRWVVCGWCGHSARAVELLRAGAAGPPGSAARLVARLGTPG
jgi:hypothetical protein